MFNQKEGKKTRQIRTTQIKTQATHAIQAAYITFLFFLLFFSMIFLVLGTVLSSGADPVPVISGHIIVPDKYAGCHEVLQNYFKCIKSCYQGVLVNFTCLNEKHDANNPQNCTHYFNSQQACKELVGLNCSGTFYYPGDHSGENCIISEYDVFPWYDGTFKQMIFSYGKVFPAFVFDKFEMKMGSDKRYKGHTYHFHDGKPPSELRVVEGTYGEGGGKGEGGSEGDNSGGDGGKGANIVSPANKGERGGRGSWSGGFPGGRIMFITKEFIIDKFSKINADGNIGWAGYLNQPSGGGGGGGMIFIITDYFFNNGTITARGGSGVAGCRNKDWYGGGGGDGGTIYLFVNKIEGEGNISVKGGYGGCSKWQLQEGKTIKAKVEYKNNREFYKLGGYGDDSSSGWLENDGTKFESTDLDLFAKDQKMTSKDTGGADTYVELKPVAKSVAGDSIDYKWPPLLYSRWDAIIKYFGDAGIECIDQEGKRPGEKGNDGGIFSFANCFFLPADSTKAFLSGDTSVLQSKKNDEQWCDWIPNETTMAKFIGVSSRLYTCNNGVIEQQEIDDTRTEICVQDKISEIRDNPTPFCFIINEKDTCNNQWFCNWDDTLGCLPKYSRAWENCSVYGSNITSITLTSTTSNIQLNSSTYYQNYANAVISQLRGSRSNQLSNFIAKCNAVGDCGNKSHFVPYIKTEPGYSFVVFPPLNDKASAVMFRCEHVISSFDETGSNCDLCNLPGEHFGFHFNCTEYTCQSLGSNCVFDNENKVCKANFSADFEVNITEKITLSPYRPSEYSCSVSYDKILKKGNITCTGTNACIQPYSTLVLNYASSDKRDILCRAAFYNSTSVPLDKLPWENMTTASDSDFFMSSHSWHIPPGFFTFPSNINNVDNADNVDENLFNATLVLLCKDRFNNNVASKLDFCISKNDVFPPYINTNLKNGTLMPGQQTIEIYTNEPIDTCTWNTSNNQQGILKINNFTYHLTGLLQSNFTFDMPYTKLDLSIKCNDTIGLVTETLLSFEPEEYKLKVNLVSPKNNSVFFDCKDISININVNTTDESGNHLLNANCKVFKNGQGQALSLTQNQQQHTFKITAGNGTHDYLIDCSSIYGSDSTTLTITALISNETEIEKIEKQDYTLSIYTIRNASCYILSNENVCENSTQSYNHITIDYWNQEFGQSTKISTNTRMHHVEIPSQISRLYFGCENACGKRKCFKINVLK